MSVQRSKSHVPSTASVRSNGPEIRNVPSPGAYCVHAGCAAEPPPAHQAAPLPSLVLQLTTPHAVAAAPAVFPSFHFDRSPSKSSEKIVMPPLEAPAENAHVPEAGANTWAHAFFAATRQKYVVLSVTFDRQARAALVADERRVRVGAEVDVVRRCARRRRPTSASRCPSRRRCRRWPGRLSANAPGFVHAATLSTVKLIVLPAAPMSWIESPPGNQSERAEEGSVVSLIAVRGGTASEAKNACFRLPSLVGVPPGR